jgi:hypothetical protein
MKYRIFAIVSVLGASLCVACGSDDDNKGSGSAELKANCEKICAVTQPLKCASDPSDCVNDCQLNATASAKCRTVIEANLACSATRPATDWACDADTGESALSESACTAETDAVFNCLLGG